MLFHLHRPSSITTSLRRASYKSSSSNAFLLAALSLLSIVRSLSLTATMRGGGTGGRPRPFSPTASPTVGRGTSLKAVAFSTPESLSEWLRPRLPSETFASWGVKPGTKTVHNLWLELAHGETSLLHEDPVRQQEEEEEKSQRHLLLRTVHVATVRIRNKAGALLVESHQLLSDGTTRSRNRPLSEKMKPGETVDEAVVRAVVEELGVTGVRILPGTYETRVEDRASFSYPGLPARYILHSVDAEVDGIPQEGEFSSEEAGEECEESGTDAHVVSVKTHFWKWAYGEGAGSSDDSFVPPA